jgi:hypothetical protein
VKAEAEHLPSPTSAFSLMIVLNVFSQKGRVSTSGACYIRFCVFFCSLVLREPFFSWSAFCHSHSFDYSNYLNTHSSHSLRPRSSSNSRVEEQEKSNQTKMHSLVATAAAAGLLTLANAYTPPQAQTWGPLLTPDTSDVRMPLVTSRNID